jgi:hypothetical protein
MAKAKLLEERVGRARLPNGLMVFPENVVVDSPFIVPTPESPPSRAAARDLGSKRWHVRGDGSAGSSA